MNKDFINMNSKIIQKILIYIFHIILLGREQLYKLSNK